ncbi:hypothetical protein DRN69_06825 [Candidatus Pacearchaeota archaeon]|nr:MAG: hypothetical protein DRN69_06825 [Candidatus Pacearchaeota archaeon]
MDINCLNLDTLKKLGYEEGISLPEDSLSEILPQVAELRKARSITDYIVISLAELTENSEIKGLYKILIKER